MEGPAATNIANFKLQSVVYKVAHHGASTQANSLNWLTPIQSQFPAVHITLVIVATLVVSQSNVFRVSRLLYRLHPTISTVGMVQESIQRSITHLMIACLRHLPLQL